MPCAVTELVVGIRARWGGRERQHDWVDVANRPVVACMAYPWAGPRVFQVVCSHEPHADCPYALVAGPVWLVQGCHALTKLQACSSAHALMRQQASISSTALAPPATQRHEEWKRTCLSPAAPGIHISTNVPFLSYSCAASPLAPFTYKIVKKLSFHIPHKTCEPPLSACLDQHLATPHPAASKERERGAPSLPLVLPAQHDSAITPPEEKRWPQREHPSFKTTACTVTGRPGKPKHTAPSAFQSSRVPPTKWTTCEACPLPPLAPAAAIL